MTDGVSRGVDFYGVPPTWREAYKLATEDPAEESDPTGSRWPRSKRHDDKALAVIQIGSNGSTSA